jgi:23S rRNA pseudouridine955/2504/2580 synthase
MSLQPVKMHQVLAHESGQRLDNLLLKLCKGLPRSVIYRWIRTGQVRINKKRIEVSQRLVEGDQVRIPPFDSERELDKVHPIPLQQSEALAKQVVFEDDAWLVINKPSGLASHSGSGIDVGAIDVCRVMRPDNILYLGHRLDRETSGCLLFAKNREAVQSFQQALTQKTVKKHYLAYVQGRWVGKTHTVNKALEPGKLKGEKHIWVSPEGQEAQTIFQILAHDELGTWVQATPLTGRTHQIRVHAASMGYPIWGDKKYGYKPDARFKPKRLLLHAWRLSWPSLDSKKQLRAEALVDETIRSLLPKNLKSQF